MPPRKLAPLSPRVALLRGVNVGAKQVAMADLRALATSLGFQDVGTLINSGNLVYRTNAATSTAQNAALLHDAIASKLGIRCTVFVRTLPELTAVLAENPLTNEAELAPSKLLVTLWDHDVTDAQRAAFAATPLTDERFVLGPSAFYCWFPNGLSASKPYEVAARRLGDHITGRNWSTMQKLHARLEALAALPGSSA